MVLNFKLKFIPLMFFTLPIYRDLYLSMFYLCKLLVSSNIITLCTYLKLSSCCYKSPKWNICLNLFHLSRKYGAYQQQWETKTFNREIALKSALAAKYLIFPCLREWVGKKCTQSRLHFASTSSVLLYKIMLWEEVWGLKVKRKGKKLCFNSSYLFRNKMNCYKEHTTPHKSYPFFNLKRPSGERKQNSIVTALPNNSLIMWEN